MQFPKERTLNIFTVNERTNTYFDTTLRDGEQCPGAAMNVEQKIQVAMQLETLGVDIIEAGFPVISDGDFRAVRAVGRGKGRGLLDSPGLLAWFAG